MSDFLTRLAARQLGAMETIEPRIKPRYAPPAHESQAAPIAEEIVAPAPRRDENVGTIPTMVLKPAKLDSPRPGFAATEHKRTAVEHPAEVHADPPGRRTRFDSDLSARASEPIQRVQMMSKDQPATARTISPAQSAAALQSFDALTPKSSGSSSGDKSTPIVMVKTEPAPVSLVQSAKANPARPDVTLTAPPSISSRNERAQQPAKSSAEPPIQVTIGRIEVTAITQAAVLKRAAPARKPAPSLDDYLARRHGRER